MAKFNMPTSGKNKTKNYAGGNAYHINDLKTKLSLGVLTTLMNEPKYYGDNTNELVQNVRAMLDMDAKFVANLAIYTRKEIRLRSVVHMLIGELAHHAKGKIFVRHSMGQVVERVDDMTEIMAYYINTYGKPIPNSLKKGMSDVFWKFDEYSLAKYNRNGQVELKDIILLTNIRNKKNTDKQNELMQKVISGDLKTPITWETQLSVNDGRTKKEKWESLIENKQLGYMASLRNLRNILEVDVSDEHLEAMLSYLSDKRAIENGKQMPFRYFSAWREMVNNPKTTSRVLDALETAMELSVSNLPRLSGKTFIASDVSGSMRTSISSKSKVTYKDIGTLMMAMAHKICDEAITSVFASKFKVVNASTKNSILSNMNTFGNIHVGLATYLHLVLSYLIENKINVDRIIVFSDMQCYRGRMYGDDVQALLNEYKSKINPDVWFHSIDLSYGTTSAIMPNKKVNLIGGWSEKILSYISEVEQDGKSLSQKIDTYYFN